jgi:DNA helicase II / ATP-dependent DNA helicase PcrA
VTYAPYSNEASSSRGFSKRPSAPGASPPATSGASLSELNASQREAVTTLSGPLLVLAGAGTGKTRVITFRMAELIRNGVEPHRILSVTFTNKAAKEMQERMGHLLGRRLRTRPQLSTFHSLCVRVLREEIEALGYPKQFVIYDRGDQESAARKALRDIRVGDATLKPGDLLSSIGRWKMNGVLPDRATDFINDDRDFLAASAYRRYQLSLRAAGAVDFDDLLLLTAQLFEEFPESLARQQDKFDHVQIDEYQDTNEMQFQIVSALVRPHRNLCVVGDDDQSIYGWRGAEVKHILGFQQKFPGAKVVRLQDNYRCTTEILELANQLVHHNRGRHKKVLVAHKSGAEVVVKPYPDEELEAEGVVREINYLVKELRAPVQDFAILFRTNEQPRLFESELRRVRLPYVLVGGQSFFDRREVRDMMAYLKVIVQPLDEVSLLRIINVPTRGIGDASVEKLLNRAVKSGRKIWDVVDEAVGEKEVTAKTAANIKAFRELLNEYHERFHAPGASLAATFEALIDTIDYESEIAKQYKEVQQQLIRSGIIEECVTALRQYEQATAKPTLSDFLESTSLNGNDREFGENKEFEQPAIKLMTLHSAKGLEFPRVYLVGWEEGLLPHQRSVDDASPTAIEEERRLAYVGITRARDHLGISHAMTRMKWGKRRDSIPSRFLREMNVPLDEQVATESGSAEESSFH